MHDMLDFDVCFQEGVKEAERLLAGMKLARGRNPKISGLNGWVFEQLIRSALEDELSKQAINVEIREQAAIKGRAKLDLLVGNVGIEVKSAGLFGLNDAERYRRYRNIMEAKGLLYLYVTRYETHRSYYEATLEVFGRDRAFFLSEEGEWQRFVAEVCRLTTGCSGCV